MSRSAKPQELTALAVSLRETAARLRKAAKMLAATQTHEQLKATRAFPKPSKNGDQSEPSEIRPTESQQTGLKSSTRIQRDKKPKAKKTTRKKRDKK